MLTVIAVIAAFAAGYGFRGLVRRELGSASVEVTKVEGEAKAKL
jgi:hypothetical protein